MADDIVTAEQSQKILDFATRYAKGHWEVNELAAHLSVDETGTIESDGEGSYFVCLDMPGVGDIQRIIVVLNDDGTVELDHTYGDDMGCEQCQFGRMRQYSADEED